LCAPSEKILKDGIIFFVSARVSGHDKHQKTLTIASIPLVHLSAIRWVGVIYSVDPKDLFDRVCNCFSSPSDSLVSVIESAGTCDDKLAKIVALIAVLESEKITLQKEIIAPSLSPLVIASSLEKIPFAINRACIYAVHWLGFSLEKATEMFGLRSQNIRLNISRGLRIAGYAKDTKKYPDLLAWRGRRNRRAQSNSSREVLLSSLLTSEPHRELSTESQEALVDAFTAASLQQSSLITLCSNIRSLHVITGRPWIDEPPKQPVTSFALAAEQRSKYGIVRRYTIRSRNDKWNLEMLQSTARGNDAHSELVWRSGEPVMILDGDGNQVAYCGPSSKSVMISKPLAQKFTIREIGSIN
jgi:hypothetical protein